jgi:histidyl-tRNA synthetase
MAVEYGLRHAPIRKQLDLAAARGAPRAVIIGPDERAAGMALVRDLKTGTEAKVPLDKLLNGFFD